GGRRDAGPSAEGGEREEEGEDDEPEARDRKERPALRGHAQRDRQAQRAVEPVRGAEAPPDDDGQRDEEDQEGELLQVDRRDAERRSVAGEGPVAVVVRA